MKHIFNNKLPKNDNIVSILASLFFIKDCNRLSCYYQFEKDWKDVKIF